MTLVAPEDPHRLGWMLLRGLLPGYALLGLLWAASARVPRLTALGLGAWVLVLVLVLVLALPMMLALWHQATVRRLVLLHQFEPGQGLHH